MKPTKRVLTKDIRLTIGIRVLKEVNNFAQERHVRNWSIKGGNRLDTYVKIAKLRWWHLDRMKQIKRRNLHIEQLAW